MQEFSTSRNDLYIRLQELKEYAEAKRENPSLFGAREMTVFYSRSDNQSDEQKERIIDFRNYDDNGKWFCYNRDAAQADELHRRFWVGSIAELLQKVSEERA